MKPISVVIPTANRPHYLETALSSVAAQTMVGDIEEVLVSENLGCRESEAVCACFPQLPIRYTLREPQLGNTEHIQALFLEARAPFVALLCDDDWWSPAHLHSAWTALSHNPTASARFGAVLNTASEEECHDVHILRPFPFTFAVKATTIPEVLSPTAVWLLTMEQVFLITWLLTPFHFSTMLARREALHDASQYMTEAHPWGVDRILYNGLVLHGSLLYDPLPDTFARCHPGNWMKDKIWADLVLAHRESSEKIRLIAQEHGVDVVAKWNAIVPTIPKNMKHEFVSHFRGILTDEQLRQWGFAQFIARPFPSLPVRLGHKAIRIARRTRRASNWLRQV